MINRLQLHQNDEEISVQRLAFRNTVFYTTPAWLLGILMIGSLLFTSCISTPGNNTPYDKALLQYEAAQYQAVFETLKPYLPKDADPPVLRDEDPEWMGDAIVLIGKMHENGLGTPKDSNKALKYYSAAAGSLSIYTSPNKEIARVSFDHNGAAYHRCLLSRTFQEVKDFCRPFKGKELKDYPNALRAYQRYIDFLDVENPDLKLIRAITVNDMYRAKVAIQQGANINTVFPEGEYTREATPLQVAVVTTNPQMVNLLFESDADPNIYEGIPSLLQETSSRSAFRKSSGAVGGRSLIEPLLAHGYKPTKADLNALHRLSEKELASPEDRGYYALALRNADAAVKKSHFAYLKEVDAQNAQRIRNSLTLQDEREGRRRLIGQAELQQKRTIGTRVCRSQENIVFTGFVERVSESKLQIRVTRAHLSRHPDLQPGGFKPEIIWDYPDNWMICE